MYRFLDSWVVERTLFEFVNQGGCACCGMMHGGNRVQDLMAMCTDFESDDGKKEKKSPWPDAMRDEIWSERVRFRRELRDRMSVYKERFPRPPRRAGGGSDSGASSGGEEGEEEDDDESQSAEEALSSLSLNEANNRTSNRPSFFDWFRSLDANAKRQCFQMPRDELLVQINTTFSFKPAYQVVLCAVLEQLTHFDETGYTNDGATEAEVTFEECLQYERGAFTLIPEFFTTDDGLDVLFARFRELAGPHLLGKRDAERIAVALSLIHI